MSKASNRFTKSEISKNAHQRLYENALQSPPTKANAAAHIRKANRSMKLEYPKRGKSSALTTNRKALTFNGYFCS